MLSQPEFPEIKGLTTDVNLEMLSQGPGVRGIRKEMEQEKANMRTRYGVGLSQGRLLLKPSKEAYE